jgi:hypothetical protein
VAGRPFFRVTFCGFRISLLARHLRQYACISCYLPSEAFPPPDIDMLLDKHTYFIPNVKRNRREF